MVVPTMTASPPVNPMTRRRPSSPAMRPPVYAERPPLRAAASIQLAGLLQDVERRRAEVLHDETVPGGRPAQVGDVRVESLPQLAVALPYAVGQRARRTQEEAALQVGILGLGGQGGFQAVRGRLDAPGLEGLGELPRGDRGVDAGDAGGGQLFL